MTPPLGTSQKTVQVWQGLRRKGLSPFGSLAAWGDVSEAAQTPVSPFVELPRLVGLSSEPASYWPLEWFRGNPEVSVPEGARRFLSSGTTRSSRSEVVFSAAGVAAYRELAVATFGSVLAATLGDGWREAQGISMVPPPSAWPDSSLAQMVAWIGHELPVSYCQEDELATTIHALPPDRPVWLFATAFHLVNALDDGRCRPLPPGSLVIETGGTKGRSRSIERGELYSAVAAAFGLREEQILSEYGMCELASQAYDFVPRGVTRPLAQRRFQFPGWVHAAVVTGPGRAGREGIGALLVDDPLRLDLPWPLRTEDLIDLAADGSFRLLGRAPVAPLKGCSLAAELPAKVAQRDAAVPADQRDVGQTSQIQAFDRAEALARAPHLAALMQSLKEPVWEQRLAAELGSERSAKAAIQDILQALPKTNAAWVDAALVALGGRDKAAAAPLRWRFILPGNHSVVGLQPLALAYLAGRHVRVRLPSRFAAGRSLLEAFIEDLAKLPGAQLVSTRGRLEDEGEALAAGEMVLAYGDDETLAQLQKLVGSASIVRGFGDRVGISVIDAAHLGRDAGLLVADHLALGQSGCMASRLTIAVGSNHVASERMAHILLRSGMQTWGAALPTAVCVGQELERCRLMRLGFQTYGREHAPLVAILQVAAQDLNSELITNSLAQAPMVIPLLCVTGQNWQPFVKTALASLHQVRLGTLTFPAEILPSDLTDSSYKRAPCLRPLGTGNAPLWDGRHEGESLFSLLT